MRPRAAASVPVGTSFTPCAISSEIRGHRRAVAKSIRSGQFYSPYRLDPVSA
jgi:hypothetical protein